MCLYDLFLLLTHVRSPQHVFAQEGGGGAAALGGAHGEEGAGLLRAHCGHCGSALPGERPGQKENNRYKTHVSALSRHGGINVHPRCPGRQMTVDLSRTFSGTSSFDETHL